MKPTLFYSAGVCSLASHIAFEEAGADVEYVRLDFAKGEQRAPEYLRMNPQGLVPLVMTDQGPLTESPAILAWIAQTWPAANLAPLSDPWALAQVNAFNNYLSGTLHGLAFAGIFQAARFADGEVAQAAVKSKALQSLNAAFELIETKLGDDGWVHATYTTSDPYLMVLASWLAHIGQDIAQYQKVAAHSKRVLARPAVQRAVAAEGLHL